MGSLLKMCIALLPILRDWQRLPFFSMCYKAILNEEDLKLMGHVAHTHCCIWKYQKHTHTGKMLHHTIDFRKPHAGDFGKAGVRHSCWKGNRSFCPPVTMLRWEGTQCTDTDMGKLWESGAAPIIGMVLWHYNKALEEGKLLKQPVLVKAKCFGRRAEDIQGLGSLFT